MQPIKATPDSVDGWWDKVMLGLVSCNGNVWGVWWEREKSFNREDGRGGVEGERSSSSFRLTSDGCGHLIEDGEDEIVGRNWEVIGGGEMFWFISGSGTVHGWLTEGLLLHPVNDMERLTSSSTGICDLRVNHLDLQKRVE